jgi:hypothetical protein
LEFLSLSFYFVILTLESWLWLEYRMLLPSTRRPSPTNLLFNMLWRRSCMLTLLIASIWTARQGIQISMETINKMN